MAVDLRLTHFAFGADDGNEAAHTLYTTDQNRTVAVDTPFLLRFLLQEAGGTAIANVAPQFQYNLNGAGWVNITTTSAVVKAVAVGAFANGDNCTSRLGGSGTFESTGAGCTEDGLSGGSANDIVASGNSETECGLQIVGGKVADGDTIQIVCTCAQTTITANVTASITVDRPDGWYLVQQSHSGTGNSALTGVVAGNVIVVACFWEEAAGVCTITDGTTSLVMRTASNYSGEIYGQFGYLLSANAGNKTYTITFPGGAGGPSSIVFEFNYQGSATLGYDTECLGNGASTNPNSADMTTYDGATIVVGLEGNYSGVQPSAYAVGGVATTTYEYEDTNYRTAWCKILSATMTGDVACTMVTAHWVCNGISIKATAGGASNTPLDDRGMLRGEIRGMNRGMSRL